MPRRWTRWNRPVTLTPLTWCGSVSGRCSIPCVSIRALKPSCARSDSREAAPDSLEKSGYVNTQNGESPRIPRINANQNQGSFRVTSRFIREDSQFRHSSSFPRNRYQLQLVPKLERIGPERGVSEC